MSLTAFIIASLIATDVIPAGDVITSSNTTGNGNALTRDEEQLIGREVRRTIYVGQVVDPANTKTPRVVSRNQTVTVRYIRNGLEISLSGRAMGNAGVGESITVMNIESRAMINGLVTDQGWVRAE
ncbi:MAG: flagellar basal body P-ring formation chaperone FlgA [Pseudomonadota bacterium]